MNRHEKIAEVKEDGRTKYDEIDILRTVYRFRLLSTEQFTMLYCKGNRHTAYKKIKHMENRGLIASHFFRIGRSGGAKKVLFIADGGIQLLRSSDKVEKSYRSPSKNKPAEALIPYLVKANNTLFNMARNGLNIIDSREWKSRHGMNRRAKVRGGLACKDGRAYGIYMFIERFSHVVDEEGKFDTEVTDMALYSILREIASFGQTGRVIIFTQHIDAYLAFLKHPLFSETAKKMLEMCVLPPFEQSSLDIIELNRDISMRAEQLQSILGGTITVTDSTERHEPFAAYTHTAEGGTRSYVVDHLTCNWSAIHRLTQYYNPSQYRGNQDKLRVKLVCWGANRMDIEEILARGYEEYVDYYEAGRDEAIRWLSADKE